MVVNSAETDRKFLFCETTARRPNSGFDHRVLRAARAVPTHPVSTRYDDITYRTMRNPLREVIGNCELLVSVRPGLSVGLLSTHYMPKIVDGNSRQSSPF